MANATPPAKPNPAFFRYGTPDGGIGGPRADHPSDPCLEPGPAQWTALDVSLLEQAAELRKRHSADNFAKLAHFVNLLVELEGR